jgi:Flp pilus assembly protein TadG
MWSIRARQPERKSERGVSSIELVLYMPLLMMTIFLTVQFALVYLGNQVISSSARQAALFARAGVGAGAGNAGAVSTAQAEATAVAKEYADKVGHGLVTNVHVDITRVDNVSGRLDPEGGLDMRVVVTGHALQLVPGVAAPVVSKTVQGPIESFRVDTP